MGQYSLFLTLGEIDDSMVPDELIVNYSARRIPFDWEQELIRGGSNEKAWTRCEDWLRAAEGLWATALGHTIRNDRLEFRCKTVERLGVIRPAYTALTIRKKPPKRAAAEPLVIATFCVICCVVGLIAAGTSIAKIEKDAKISLEREEFIRMKHEEHARAHAAESQG